MHKDSGIRMQWRSVWEGWTYDYYARPGGFRTEGVSIRSHGHTTSGIQHCKVLCLFCGLMYYGMLPDISNLV